MADPLSWLQQLLGGGQGAQGDDALGQLQGRLAPDPNGQALPPQTASQWARQTLRAPTDFTTLRDLSTALGMPSALEQSAAASAANPYQPGMTAGQMLAGRPDDPVASSFYPGVGVGAIKAYHGSPHDFDRFDLSKIGTGEGAQAYGHGLYFAGSEDVAKSYRNQLADWKVGGEVADAANPVHAAAATLKAFDGDAAQAMTELRRTATQGPLEERAVATQAIELLRKGEPLPPVTGGHMYEAQINAEPEQFLDWDKPLSQQSQQVQDAIKQHRGMAGFFEQNPNATGEQLYRYKTNPTGGGFPEKAGAAETMKAFGIPGIRYLDQGSRGAGAGTYNYSVFDDKLIEILRKYGILPPLAGAAGAGLLGAGSEPPT